MIKRVLLIAVCAILMIALMSCAERKQTNSTPSTTEPVVETTDNKTLPNPDRALFEQLYVGMPFEDYWALFSGFAYDFVDTRCIHKYICSDGTEMYVEYKMVFDDHNDFDLELKGIFETCPEIPLYDRADFDGITVGMTEKEVYEILGFEGIDIGSGRLISQYECTDGSTVVISYDNSIELNAHVVAEINYKQG